MFRTFSSIAAPSSFQNSAPYTCEVRHRTKSPCCRLNWFERTSWSDVGPSHCARHVMSVAAHRAELSPRSCDGVHAEPDCGDRCGGRRGERDGGGGGRHAGAGRVQVRQQTGLQRQLGEAQTQFSVVQRNPLRQELTQRKRFWRFSLLLLGVAHLFCATGKNLCSLFAVKFSKDAASCDINPGSLDEVRLLFYEKLFSRICGAGRRVCVGQRDAGHHSGRLLLGLPRHADSGRLARPGDCTRKMSLT